MKRKRETVIKEFSFSRDADICVVSTKKEMSSRERRDVFDAISLAWRRKFKDPVSGAIPREGILIATVGPFNITELREKDLNMAGWYKKDSKGLSCQK